MRRTNVKEVSLRGVRHVAVAFVTCADAVSEEKKGAAVLRVPGCRRRHVDVRGIREYPDLNRVPGMRDPAEMQLPPKKARPDAGKRERCNHARHGFRQETLGGHGRYRGSHVFISEVRKVPDARYGHVEWRQDGVKDVRRRRYPGMK